MDFAVVLADIAPKGLSAKLLRSEPLCFVIPSRHPLANQKFVSREELKKILKGISLPVARLMMIEAHRQSTNPNVELVKKSLRETLMVETNRHENLRSA